MVDSGMKIVGHPLSQFKQGDPLYTIVGKGSGRAGEEGLQFQESKSRHLSP